MDTPMLPDAVFKEMREHVEDGELPPLIFLKDGDYNQFHKHTVSHPSWVTEAMCLSDIGSKFMKGNYYNCDGFSCVVLIMLRCLYVLCVVEIGNGNCFNLEHI